MLSWSSTEQGDPADLAAVVAGTDRVGLPLGAELMRFASACAGTDDEELAAARAALTFTAGEALMVDAAAVAANFEMMTRLADGTGAAMPEVRKESSSAVIDAYGLTDLTSAR